MNSGCFSSGQHLNSGFAIFQVHYSLLREAQYFRIPGVAVEKECYWRPILGQHFRLQE